MPWTPVIDTETPNWGPILTAPGFGAFQVGPFQTNFQQGGIANPWSPVIDTEVPGWAPLP